MEDELTAREREVMALVKQGKRNWQIAQELVISENTVENHLHSIFQKMGVSNRTEAAVRYLRHNRMRVEQRWEKIEDSLHEENPGGRYNPS